MLGLEPKPHLVRRDHATHAEGLSRHLRNTASVRSQPGLPCSSERDPFGVSQLECPGGDGCDEVRDGEERGEWCEQSEEGVGVVGDHPGVGGEDGGDRDGEESEPDGL